MITGIVGLDISRGKATACHLEEEPADLLEFARSYQPQNFGTSQADLDALARLSQVFVLEPTGSDHKIFVEHLRRQGKVVLGATGIRIRNHAKENGILNKADREDAAVIAAFGLKHLRRQNHKAFVSIDAIEIKEKYRSLQALTKQRTALINQLRSRLVYECPELHNAKSMSRVWMEPKPPAIWRAIAGEELLHPKATRVPEVTTGRGISEFSRQLAVQICSLERLTFSVECECNDLLNSEDFSFYRQVLNNWSINDTTQVALIAACYPLEQFLKDGKPLLKRVYSTDKSHQNRTVRNRSLKQFKRALGAGRQWIQSGKKEFWAKTGDRQTRAAIYSYLEMAVVTRRQPSLMRLQKLYPDLAQQIEGLKGKKRKAVLDRYCFRSLMEQAGASTSNEPWKSDRLVEVATEITKMSPAICRLQLFYEFAPQCQNRAKKERLMKVYPRFIEWLFKDLVSAYQQEGEHNRVGSVLRRDFEKAVSLQASYNPSGERSASGRNVTAIAHAVN
jgi:hypothetical protein